MSERFIFEDFVKRTCDYGISLQSSDGSMPPGRNGPHDHNMTGARTTAHWAILFAFAFKALGNSRYRDCANAAYDVLTSHKFRPIGGSYWHRRQDYRTSYNGLIGQAWTLESLYYGYRCLNREDLLDSGKDLVLIHPFCSVNGLWNEIDLDGSIKGIGETLNQQIWFAAMASRFLGANSDETKRFLEMLIWNARIRRCGLFFTAINERKLFRRSIRKIRKRHSEGILVDKRINIDNGYHLFTMVGLAMLYETNPDHEFFRSKLFRRALLYTFSQKYSRDLKRSIYGYQYNVPGFEFPFAYSVFKDILPDGAIGFAMDACRHQLLAHMNRENGLLTESTVDSMTLVARTYEVCRVPPGFWQNVQLDLSV